MPAYIYLVEDLETGQQHLRTALAESLTALVDQALEQGERVVQFTEITRKPWSRVPLRVEDKAALYRHLASLLEAGMPLLEALQLMGRETTHESVRHALHDITQRMRMGESFAEAAVRYPDVFDEHLVRMLQAAEKGGTLDVALREMANHLEEMAELSRKLAPLFIYPVLVMSVVAGVFGFFLIYIAPQFLHLYQEMGIGTEDLPAPTRYLAMASSFLTGGLLALVLVVVGSLALRLFWPSVYFHLLHWLLPRLPLGPWQEILYHWEMTRFVMTLSLLLRHSVPLVPALRLAAQAFGHPVYQKGALRCAGLVGLGHSFSEAVREVDIFPETLTTQLSLAEREGDLSAPLQRLARLYRHQAEYLSRRGLHLLEPALIVAIGFVVFLILFSVFRPLITIISALTSGNF